jgi:ATP synthase protein I
MRKNLSEDPEGKRILPLIGIFMTIPFVLAVPPVIGWAIGNWFERHFEFPPLFTYVLMVLGFAAGVREFLRLIKKYGSGLE